MKQIQKPIQRNIISFLVPSSEAETPEHQVEGLGIPNQIPDCATPCPHRSDVYPDLDPVSTRAPRLAATGGNDDLSEEQEVDPVPSPGASRSATVTLREARPPPPASNQPTFSSLGLDWLGGRVTS